MLYDRSNSAEFTSVCPSKRLSQFVENNNFLVSISVDHEEFWRVFVKKKMFFFFFFFRAFLFVDWDCENPLSVESFYRSEILNGICRKEDFQGVSICGLGLWKSVECWELLCARLIWLGPCCYNQQQLLLIFLYFVSVFCILYFVSVFCILYFSKFLDLVFSLHLNWQHWWNWSGLAPAATIS